MIFKSSQTLAQEIFSPHHSLQHDRGFVLVRHVSKPAKSSRTFPRIPLAKLSIILLLGLFSVQSYYLIKDWSAPAPMLDPLASSSESLYLLDQAKLHVTETDAFELKVRAVSERLEIAPEWLMAAMYTESRFNPAIKNRKGSGATGLIQFMVPAVKDLNRRLGTKYYMSDIQAMSALDQLDLVEAYLETIQERYREFHSLTDVYLAILYPKGLEFGPNQALFSNPTRAYRQNSGLDENKDGHVTPSDIDARMARIFPTAAAIATK